MGNSGGSKGWALALATENQQCMSTLILSPAAYYLSPLPFTFAPRGTPPKILGTPVLF